MLKKLFIIGLLLVGCSSDNGYPTLDGTSIDVTAPGKLLVINYWAVWCAPCRKEIPELNELAAHHVDKLDVLGVNFDGSQGETLRSEITKLGIQFPSFIRDPRVTWGLEPVSILPETLIISPDGTLLHRLIGPQTLSSIEALL
jgi:thiol-disulfide isomerase/thioredoxin|tara:strand:+ start:3409 stop:3837 length:429 start_codon:yes stop_codon:yes gene_type:complete